MWQWVCEWYVYVTDFTNCWSHDEPRDSAVAYSIVGGGGAVTHETVFLLVDAAIEMTM